MWGFLLRGGMSAAERFAPRALPFFERLAARGAGGAVAAGEKVAAETAAKTAGTLAGAGALGTGAFTLGGMLGGAAAITTTALVGAVVVGGGYMLYRMFADSEPSKPAQISPAMARGTNVSASYPAAVGYMSPELAPAQPGTNWVGRVSAAPAQGAPAVTNGANWAGRTNGPVGESGYSTLVEQQAATGQQTTL